MSKQGKSKYYLYACLYFSKRRPPICGVEDDSAIVMLEYPCNAVPHEILSFYRRNMLFQVDPQFLQMIGLARNTRLIAVVHHQTNWLVKFLEYYYRFLEIPHKIIRP